jgi:hypothetical protein
MSFTPSNSKEISSDSEIISKLEKEQEFVDELEKREITRKNVENLRFLFAFFTFGIGMLFIYADFRGVSIESIFYTNLQAVLGATIVLIGMFFFILTNKTISERFQNVDIRRRLGIGKTVVSPNAAWPFPTGDRPRGEDEDEDGEDDDEEEEDVGDDSADFGGILKGKLETTQKSIALHRKDHFREYFNDIASNLDQRISDADEKASLLLDKGTSYTTLGIAFFILSIIVWQVLAWIHGFKTEFLYGIASCSGLFIFIEFLSAWFLRQYRHYVDTSTYLVKVKAIFDRFMLVYLTQKSLSTASKDPQHENSLTLLRMLEKEIQWPDSYLLKKADISFAKEALDTLSDFTKNLRKKEKKSAPKSTSKEAA